MSDFETFDTPYNFVVIPLDLLGFSCFSVHRNIRPLTPNVLT